MRLLISFSCRLRPSTVAYFPVFLTTVVPGQASPWSKANAYFTNGWVSCDFPLKSSRSGSSKASKTFIKTSLSSLVITRSFSLVLRPKSSRIVLRISAVMDTWVAVNVSWLNFVDRELRILEKQRKLFQLKSMPKHNQDLSMWFSTFLHVPYHIFVR